MSSAVAAVRVPLPHYPEALACCDEVLASLEIPADERRAFVHFKACLKIHNVARNNPIGSYPQAV